MIGKYTNYCIPGKFDKDKEPENNQPHKVTSKSKLVWGRPSTKLLIEDIKRLIKDGAEIKPLKKRKRRSKK